MKNKEINKVTLYSEALMMLTGIHHVYGALLYNTPWRMHVLFLSIPTMIVTLVLHRSMIRGKGKRIPAWIYWIITGVVSVALIGLYEGVYNHALKNILYYAGLRHGLLMRLFPPPLYEMPNDFWFEFTGVLQAVTAILLIVPFSRLTARLFKSPAS